MKQEEFMYLVNVANILSKKMLTFVKAEGINIIIADGAVAGQKGLCGRARRWKC